MRWLSACLLVTGCGLPLPTPASAQATELRGDAGAAPLAEPQNDAQAVAESRGVTDATPLPEPQFEASAGYGFLAGGQVLDGYGPGWLFGFGWNASRRLAIVMEAGSNRLRQDVGLLDVTADFHQLMAGARFMPAGGRVRPFAHALFGGSRIDYAATADFPFRTSGIFDESRWAWQVGGGLDVAMAPPESRRFALRIGIDYRRVQVFEPFGQMRVSTVFVYRFLDRPAGVGARPRARAEAARGHPGTPGSRRLR